MRLTLMHDEEELFSMNYPMDPAHAAMDSATASIGFTPIVNGLAAKHACDYHITTIDWSQWPIVTAIMEEALMNTNTNPMDNQLEQMNKEESTQQYSPRAARLETKTAARDMLRELGLSVSNKSYTSVWRKPTMIFVAQQCAKQYDHDGSDLTAIYTGYYDMAKMGMDITQLPLTTVEITQSKADTTTTSEQAQGMAAKGDDAQPVNELVDFPVADSTFTPASPESQHDHNSVNTSSLEEQLSAMTAERNEAVSRLNHGIDMYNDLKSKYNGLFNAYSKLNVSVTSQQRAVNTVTNTNSNHDTSTQPHASTCGCGTVISYKNSKFSRKIAPAYPQQFQGKDYCLHCQRALLTIGHPLSSQDLIDGKHLALSVNMKAVLAHVNKNNTTNQQ